MLQMAMAYAALANGGSLYVPQVVERVDAADGHAIKQYEPKVAREIKVPAAALETWKRGMWKVTNELGGTAFEQGHLVGLPVMGKTGTAEVKKHHRHEEDDKALEDWHPNASHAWFAGWVPAEDPEVVIVVFVEHGGSGGRVAWPIAMKILQKYVTQISPNKVSPAPTIAPAVVRVKP